MRSGSDRDAPAQAGAPAGPSIVERAEVQRPQALGVHQDVYLHDLPVSDGEAGDREGSPITSAGRARGTVYERGL